MSDFFEIDFLDVQSKKSGDAIPIRYSSNGKIKIHVTDGGFQDTGDLVINHINKYYNKPEYIDAVIVTHPDGDHAGGLRKLFDQYEIGTLWMLRPWLYADELINRFSRFTSSENLAKRLREIYPNIAALEDLAVENGVDILEPFQGAKIGDFNVLAPSKSRYLDLIVESEKTPEANRTAEETITETVGLFLKKAANLISSVWGEEYFPESDTSPENNMSVVQYALLCNKKILLTGDAGRAALDEAADFAPNVGLELPGIDRMQVPHHGSRHNVSTEVLDRWLGGKHDSKPDANTCSAIISASKDDKDHPRKSVVRAFIHRGAEVISTEGSDKSISYNAPQREDWVAVTPLSYPEQQEN
ncbi:competence protein ComEC [Vibrio fluvialis]|uniref:ComEC/Rec2 family competence protein n=1 Tax=Vibrio fluvialis TaxID=676 RepID=UPI00117FB70C|nr:MBL fold metallo-hydrolase [Vibrio fluvialis]TRN14319.1 competence protein ComEC [Vibrio fluvialis]